LPNSRASQHRRGWGELAIAPFLNNKATILSQVEVGIRISI